MQIYNFFDIIFFFLKYKLTDNIAFTNFTSTEYFLYAVIVKIFPVFQNQVCDQC